MAKVLARNGKILMRNGLATVRCPGPIATISLSTRIHVRGGFSWNPASLVGTWHLKDYFSDSDPCLATAIPNPVLSIAGVRSAPCLDVMLSDAGPGDYPDQFSAVSVLSYEGASLRSSATTPASVAQLDGAGSGTAVEEDVDEVSETECVGVASALSTTARAELDIGNTPHVESSWGLVEMEARSTIQALSAATASLFSCGCCRERTLSMGVSTSGGNLACLQETTLSIQPPWTGQKLRGTLEVSGSFNASLAPGQSFYQTINAATAAIVVRWRG